MAIEVQSKTEPATAPRQKNGTWSFGPLTAARPWPFVEREKSVISLGGQDEPDLCYMYEGADGEGKSLYGTALMASGPAAFKHKPSASDDSITVLVDSRASGHYLDDPIIPSFKHRLLNYVLHITPRKILPAGGRLRNGTAEGILQGPVTDNHGEQHIARIAIFIVPCIGRYLFSVKSTTKKGVVSIFDFDNPRLELSGITVPLRAEDDDLYSFMFDSGADRHRGKELAINAMTNAQLWHRRLGHLIKISLELMQRRDGNEVAFDGSIDHFDVCAEGKGHQLAHPRKAKHVDITAPFQLVYGDLMDPFKPAARGGYEYVSKIVDQFTEWTAVYLLCTKEQALASLQLFVTSTAISFGSRIVTWRVDKDGEYTGEDFKPYCQETGITQQFTATSTPQQIGISERVGRTLCAMVRCMRVDSGLPPFLWGGLMMAASHICNRNPHSALNMETPYKKLHGKDTNLSHLKTIDARAFVRIKNPNKLDHPSWEGMVCGFSETESNSYRIWNPKTRRVVKSRNVVFIETPPNLLSAAKWLSPQHDLGEPSYDFSDDTLDDNYVSHDMLRDVQNYTSALDFDVDTPAGTVELLLPQQASPGITSPGGASRARISPREVTPEESSPPPAPAPTPAPVPAPAPGLAPTPSSAAPRATNGHANRGTAEVTPAVTRSRAARLLPVTFATRHGGGRNNNRATLTELFEAGTLKRLNELELGPPCYTQDIAHQAENASFNVEHAYVATNELGSFSGGGTRIKSQTPSRRR